MQCDFLGIGMRLLGLPPSPTLPPSGEKGAPPVTSRSSAPDLSRTAVVQGGQTLGGGRSTPWRVRDSGRRSPERSVGEREAKRE